MSGNWRASALCALFPELPWIAEPQDRSEAAEAALRSVCGGCPVRLECTSYVERAGIVSGFWAGQDRTPASDVSRSGGAA